MQPENSDLQPVPQPKGSSLYQMLKDSIKAVPIVNLAQGVLGIVCVISIIQYRNSNFLSVAISVLIMFGLMLGLQILVKTANQPNNTYRRPVEVLVWAITTFIITVMSLTILCLFAKWPRSYAEISAELYKNPLAKYDEDKNELLKQVAQLNSEKQISSNEIKTLKEKLAYIADDKVRLRIGEQRIHADTPYQEQEERFEDALGQEIQILEDRKTIDKELGERLKALYSITLFSGNINPSEPGQLQFIHDVLIKDITPEEKIQELSERIRSGRKG